ncbi:MAG: hypothetical protein H8D46_03175 [FCB group bacterium]|nr:hypothetical protein [FCB group bacterium]
MTKGQSGGKEEGVEIGWWRLDAGNSNFGVDEDLTPASAELKREVDPKCKSHVKYQISTIQQPISNSPSRLPDIYRFTIPVGLKHPEVQTFRLDFCLKRLNKDRSYCEKQYNLDYQLNPDCADFHRM